MYTRHDPIITKKIHFIKGVLKNYAHYKKEFDIIHKEYNRIIIKYSLDNKISYSDSYWKIKNSLPILPNNDNTKLCNYLTITAVHIYYLKVKGSSKQHTKDDKKYENNVYYKIAVEKLEEEFALLQKAKEERNYESIS
jgi:hypothetical protein